MTINNRLLTLPALVLLATAGCGADSSSDLNGVLDTQQKVIPTRPALCQEDPNFRQLSDVFSPESETCTEEDLKLMIQSVRPQTQKQNEDTEAISDFTEARKTFCKAAATRLKEENRTWTQNIAEAGDSDVSQTSLSLAIGSSTESGLFDLVAAEDLIRAGRCQVNTDVVSRFEILLEKHDDQVRSGTYGQRLGTRGE